MDEQVDPNEFEPPSITAPGWYRDPAPGAAVFGKRYWDGGRWTDHISPLPPTPPYGAALPPPGRSPLTSWPPPPPPGSVPPHQPRTRSFFSTGFAIVVLCLVVIVVAIAVAASLHGDDGKRAAIPLAPTAVVEPGQPAVVAYVDPTVDAATMNQATQAATQLVVAKSLPFVVSHDDVNRTIMLSPKDANGARLDADNLAAGRALQGTPHALGVEVPTAVHPPYGGCSAAPRVGRVPAPLSGAGRSSARGRRRCGH